MQTRRHRIRHVTAMSYEQPVTAYQSEIRMSPLTETGQLALENRLRVKPMTWSHVYRDYWGSQVTVMEALGEHRALEVESLSTVERSVVPAADGDGAGWDDLASAGVRDVNCEWLATTTRTNPGDELREIAHREASGQTPAAAAASIMGRIRDRMTYEAGVTAVQTSAADAWTEQRGVCQDFAHVAIGALRSLGIPSRYVSGYLAPTADQEVGYTSSGESHAWLEWWDGTWHAFDPTNGSDVGVDHVLVARGRDYSDVPPIKGVFSSLGGSTLSVEVSFTRLS